MIVKPSFTILILEKGEVIQIKPPWHPKNLPYGENPPKNMG